MLATVADDRVERRAPRPRREAGSLLDALAEMGGVSFPRGAVGKPGKRGVEHGGALSGSQKLAGTQRGAGRGRGRQTGGEPRDIGASREGEQRERAEQGGANGA